MGLTEGLFYLLPRGKPWEIAPPARPGQKGERGQGQVISINTDLI